MVSPQQRRVRRWVIGSWSILLALVFVRQLQQGWSAMQWAWAVLFSVPLLLTLPGLLAGRRYTHAWATLCVLPYFVIGITESVANARLRNWALLLLGMSLLWFFSLLAFLRVTPAEAKLDSEA